MAIPVIKLEPMRMSELSSGPASAQGQAASKYLPPNLRGPSAQGQEIAKIDMSVDSFPTLGSAPKKVVAWGAHAAKVTSATVATPVATSTVTPIVTDTAEAKPEVITLSSRIKDKIHQDTLAEIESKKPPPSDIFQMTEAQLVENGWAVLRLSSARDIVMREGDLVPGTPIMMN